MKPIYIGLVAEKGAGKGLFIKILTKLLPDKKIVSVRFSDVLQGVLTLLERGRTRENLQNLATALRSAFHDDGILNAPMRSRMRAINADIIILDGLRKPEEVSLLREFSGVLIYISADARDRYEWRKKDSENQDERNMAWEQFLKQEQAPSEISIRMMGETMADYKIENNGTKEEFTKRVKMIINTLFGRKPKK